MDVVVTLIGSGANLDIQDKVGQHASKYSYNESEHFGINWAIITSNGSHWL